MLDFLSRLFGGSKDAAERARAVNLQLVHDLQQALEGTRGEIRDLTRRAESAERAASREVALAVAEAQQRPRHAVPDFRGVLSDLAAQMRRMAGLPAVPPAPPPEAPVGLLCDIDLEALRASMKKFTEAASKIKELAGDYQDLDDLVKAVAAGSRRILKVAISLSPGPGAGGKGRNLEVRCTREEASAMLQREQARLYEEIQAEQAKAQNALNEILQVRPAPGGTPDNGQTSGRRIRRDGD